MGILSTDPLSQPSALAGTPTLVDLLVEEYRKGVESYNQDAKSLGARRDAAAELTQADHFIQFMRAWLEQHYITQTLPADKDCMVRFETNQIVRITGRAQPTDEEQQQHRPRYVAVNEPPGR